jgi:hypothetical protein
MMMDLPAPVSPVMTLQPGWNSIVKSGTSARFLMRSVVNIGRFHPDNISNHGWTWMDIDKNSGTLTSRIGAFGREIHSIRDCPRSAFLRIRVYPCASVVELNRLEAGNERKF